MKYYDLQNKKGVYSIDMVFPNWEKANEKIAIFSPHDDDGVLGAGYAISSALENGGEVYIFIFCNGDAGYSSVALKNEIVKLRELEAIKAYKKLGIKESNIIRFGYSDFNISPFVGRFLLNGERGTFQRVIEELRELQISRVVIPNGYREHIDHETVFRIGAFDAPQNGDKILVDLGKPSVVKSILQYSVWSDFSPEDSIITGRDMNIRANRAILASAEQEDIVIQAIREFKSQGEIINGLIDSRQERRLGSNFLELYMLYDARPRLNFYPYIKLIGDIEEKED